MPDSTVHFRKSGYRLFIRVEGSVVVSVLNRENSAAITIYNSPMMAEGILNDSQKNVPCEEEDFRVAYKNALAAVMNMKIV